jgi:hypothetical protein
MGTGQGDRNNATAGQPTRDLRPHPAPAIGQRVVLRPTVER